VRSRRGSSGHWFFEENDQYKTGADVIRTLADIVSKNGNLQLNVAISIPADGPA
jgi:alpha-L-fucosidase